MPGLIDLTGRRFGRLKVVSCASRGNGPVEWHCRCQCGARSVVQGSHLKSGHTRSCGCLRADVATGSRAKA